MQGTKTVTYCLTLMILSLFHCLLHLHLLCSTGAMFHLIASSNLLDRYRPRQQIYLIQNLLWHEAPSLTHLYVNFLKKTQQKSADFGTV